MVLIINTFIKNEWMMIKIRYASLTNFAVLSFWLFISEASWAVTLIINTLSSYKLMSFNLFKIKYTIIKKNTK